MKRFILSFVIICMAVSFYASSSYAASSYVLPYPSTMPGGLNYKLHLVWEKIMRYWYFGSFGQFDYTLKESDKYLVEAKTLFEYQQYLLGYQALEKSNDYFLQTLPYLNEAKQEGKEISSKRTILQEASLKHIEVLDKMKQETPASFTWSPEKNPSSQLQIHALIDTSLQDRQKYL